jgi:hypothetical protein
MEAFAVGQVCKRNRLPFVAIKGITDYATVLKNDKYRLAAITSATAFALNLIQKKATHIATLERKVGTPRLIQCLHPQPQTYCVHPLVREGEDDVWSECIDFRKPIVKSKPAWLTRVFEDVRPDAYSRSLDEQLPFMIRDGESSVTSFFPYSPVGLLQFFSVYSGDQELEKLVNKVLRDWRNNSRSTSTRNHPIAVAIAKICELARSHYVHFSTCDQVCQELMEVEGVSFADLAARFSRIIPVDIGRSGNLRNAILGDPLCVVYPCFLGLHVPTFYSNLHVTRDSFPLHDVIFVEQPIYEQGIGSTALRDNSSVGLRYFDQAHTLVVSGHPCRSINLDNGRSIYGLLKDWKKHRTEAAAEAGQRLKYRRFPLDELIMKYLPDSPLANG